MITYLIKHSLKLLHCQKLHNTVRSQFEQIFCFNIDIVKVEFQTKCEVFLMTKGVLSYVSERQVDSDNCHQTDNAK